MPTRIRYTGAVYDVAAVELARGLASGTHVVILSGGSGVLLPDEPIGEYNAAFRISWWPGAVVARSVAAYAHKRRLTSMVAFLARSSGYAKSLREINWSDQGISTYLSARYRRVNLSGHRLHRPR
jgi:hypothetical protein